MNKGLLIVISGPAGCGKGTVTSHLRKRDDFEISVSATTRAPRPTELDGREYHFITREEFTSCISTGGLLEYTEYCGNFYGTLKKETERILASGKNLILEIEVEGAENIKEQFPDAVLILLLPPSHSVQEQRLRNRGTETEEKILLRLARAKEEIYHADSYDYVVYNRDGADLEAADDIVSIVRAEKCSVKRQGDIAKKFLEN